jgi:predicted dehydrogenase
MSDNLNKKVLLIGASQMAVDYYNVLRALKCEVTVIGRSQTSADSFEELTGHKPVTGGLENFLAKNKIAFDAAIVSVGVEQLAPTTIALIKNGYKNILVEKPAGLNDEEIRDFAAVTKKNKATVLVAYNRRFYASIMKAKEIIEADGGITSFNFEFTEWAHAVEPLEKKPGIKENWFMVNSSHVIDMAFYLGGKPVEMNCFTAGKLDWHDPAVFSGAGKTKDNVLFSYQANWIAPGRWSVEMLTKNSRLIFKPIEDLFVQLKGSVAITKVEFDNSLDIQFKPGLYLQTKKFLLGDIAEFKSIEEQAEMLDIYSQIRKGN